MTDFANEVIKRMRSVTGSQKAFVPLHAPEFNGRERELLVDCIDTGWVSSVGSYVDDFESGLARIAGCEYGVAVCNGTVALKIALLIVGVKPGDEVIVPTLTFAATANAVSHLGAIPHFVDITSDTLGICPNKMGQYLNLIAERRGGATWNRKTGRRISAVVPVHIFGCPVDIDGLEACLAEWPMKIVEDAAESLGSTYKGRSCGSLSSAAAVSFNGNKIITTGGGGAILTNNSSLAKRAKHLTTTAKVPHKWEFYHDEVGYNYRMPNLNAALGVAQLEQLNDRIIKKRNLFELYKKAFEGLEGVNIFEAPEHSVSNNWLVTVILDPSMARYHKLLLASLNDAGIMTRPIWTLMHRLPMYGNNPRADLTQAEDMESRILNIPSSAYLGAT